MTLPAQATNSAAAPAVTPVPPPAVQPVTGAVDSKHDGAPVVHGTAAVISHKKYDKNNLHEFENEAPRLSSIAFSGMKFTLLEWNAVKYNLSKAACLTSLNLADIKLPQAGRLQDVLLLHKGKLTELDLSGSGLTDADIDDLISFLQNNTALEVLKLDHNKIGPVGMQRLCNALKTCTALREFSVCNNPCSKEGMQAYLDLLASGKTKLPLRIVLDGNSRDESGWEREDPSDVNQVVGFLAVLSAPASSAALASVGDVKSAVPQNPLGSAAAANAVVLAKPQSKYAQLKFESVSLSNFHLKDENRVALEELIKGGAKVLVLKSFTSDDDAAQAFKALENNQFSELTLQPGGRNKRECMIPTAPERCIYGIYCIARAMLKEEGTLGKLTYEFVYDHQKYYSNYFFLAQGLLFNTSLKELSFEYPANVYCQQLMDFALLMNRDIKQLKLTGGEVYKNLRGKTSREKQQKFVDFEDFINNRNKSPQPAIGDVKEVASPVPASSSAATVDAHFPLLSMVTSSPLQYTAEQKLNAKWLASRWILNMVLFVKSNRQDKDFAYALHEDTLEIRKILAVNPRTIVYDYIVQLRDRLAKVVREDHGAQFQSTLTELNLRITRDFDPVKNLSAVKGQQNLRTWRDYGRVAFWSGVVGLTLGGCCGCCDTGCAACCKKCDDDKFCCGICYGCAGSCDACRSAAPVQIATKSQTECCAPITDCRNAMNMWTEKGELEQIAQQRGEQDAQRGTGDAQRQPPQQRMG